MKDLIVSLFGSYVPVTSIETITNAETGDVTLIEHYVTGVAGLDWPWIAGVVLFAIVLYALLRMIGGLLKAI